MELLIKMPFGMTVKNWGWLPPTILLTGFWLGCMTRNAISYLYEQYFGGSNGPAIVELGLVQWAPVIGLCAALFVLAPHASALILSWSLLLVIVGWLVVSQVVPAPET
jgi:hypothetical protein